MTAKHGIIATKRETVEGGIMKVWYEQTKKDTGWQQLYRKGLDSFYGSGLWSCTLVPHSTKILKLPLIRFFTEFGVSSLVPDNVSEALCVGALRV